MIKEFSCEGFRNVSCTNLAFERINILIGPNNAGKTNFIRALSFAANMVNSDKSEPTGFLSELKRNGWDRIADRRSDDTRFSLSWKFKLKDDRPVEYRLQANTGRKQEDNFILSESLDSTELRDGATVSYNYFRCHDKELGYGTFSTAGMAKEQNKRLTTEVDPKETVLLQMESLFFSHQEMFYKPFIRDNIRQVLAAMRKYFSSFYSYSCTAFHVSRIRTNQDAQNAGAKLSKDGTNFVNVYQQMRKTDPKFEERYKRMLRKLICNCEDVSTQEEDGQIKMRLLMGGYSFSLSEVSDGTIHLLILLLLLSMPEENATSLLAIDEPEMNLHPAWQILLADEIVRCQGFKQCFISTHSPDFLDAFTSDFLNGTAAVFVFDPSSREKIRRLDRKDLQEDLKNWTLGDLYRIGDPVIGGWPQ